MSEKHPAWTRTRVGRNRVHWVAYDDRADSEDRRVVDQGYATSLLEADDAARAAWGAGSAVARVSPSRAVSSAVYRPRPVCWTLPSGPGTTWPASVWS